VDGHEVAGVTREQVLAEILAAVELENVTEDLEAYTINEMAQDTGMTVDTVRRKVGRAVKAGRLVPVRVYRKLGKLSRLTTAYKVPARVGPGPAQSPEEEENG